MKAEQAFAAQRPAVVKVLKHLLRLESPAKRRAAMKQAFILGALLAIATEDSLMTPENLAQLTATIPAASKGGAANRIQAEASALMSAEVMDLMQRLQQELRKRFL